MDRRSKNPTGKPAGFLFWRRPTLARPIAVLPSGLQRFTSVFEMGTGGTTALLSPEINGEGFAVNLWSVNRNSLHRFSDPRFTLRVSKNASSLASTYRKKNVIRDSSCRFTNLTSFVLFEIFHLSCLPFRETRNGLTEK